MFSRFEGFNSSVSIMRSAIVNAVNFSLYEGVKKKITAWEESEIGQ